MPSHTWTVDCWPPVRSKAFGPDGETTSTFRKCRNVYCEAVRNLRLRREIPYPEEAVSNGRSIKSVRFVLYPRISGHNDAAKHDEALRLLCMRFANFHLHGAMPDYSIIIGDVQESPHGRLETTLTW